MPIFQTTSILNLHQLKPNVLKTGPVTEPKKITGSRFTGRTGGRTAVEPMT